jgi:hypothetical protein
MAPLSGSLPTRASRGERENIWLLGRVPGGRERRCPSAKQPMIIENWYPPDDAVCLSFIGDYLCQPGPSLRMLASGACRSTLPALGGRFPGENR